MNRLLRLGFSVVLAAGVFASILPSNTEAAVLNKKTILAISGKYARKASEIRRNPRKWAKIIAREIGGSRKTQRRVETALFYSFSTGRIPTDGLIAKALKAVGIAPPSSVARALALIKTSYIAPIAVKGSMAASTVSPLVYNMAAAMAPAASISMINAGSPIGMISIMGGVSESHVVSSAGIGATASAETSASFYPFPEYRNAWQEKEYDGAAFIFIPSLALPCGSGHEESSIRLGGYYGRDLYLTAASLSNSGIRWQLVPQRPDATSFEWESPVLPLYSMTEDVYSVTLADGEGIQSEPFYLAVPRNLAPKDSFLPAGHVHAEFPGMEQTASLRAWGRVFDPLQAAARKDGHGIDSVFLRIDGQEFDVVLSADGRFDITATPTPNAQGIHSVELWANDKAHAEPVLVDAEFASVRRERFAAIRDRYLDSLSYGCSYAYWGFDASWIGAWMPDSSSAAASGKPLLDENGLLILDATASSNASRFDWKLSDRSTSAIQLLSGETTETEGITPGLYDVTLTVNSPTRPYANWSLVIPSWAESVAASDTFLLSIPPRTPRQGDALGAIHTRWVAEQSATSTLWVCYLSGHVFNEIAATLDSIKPSGLTAWAFVNGRRTDLTLNEKGHFFQRLEIGSLLAETYTISLHVATPGRQDFEVDTLTQEYLNFFVP